MTTQSGHILYALVALLSLLGCTELVPIDWTVEAVR